MMSDAKITRFAKLISWVIPGASFAVAILASIINSEFVPRRAIWGSVIFAGLWIATYLLFKFLRIRSDENSRIVSPGKQVLLFFIGAIAALWIPLLLKPFKAQKVEIILDVSQRMGEDFDSPGTTKLDAARSGVMQVLGYLESQNMEVALRLVNSSKNGQCVIEPETSLAVDFTRDFDKIRNHLVTIQPNPSDKVPVVNAIDFSIDHYLDERLFDQKYYIYSFIGGDDTCGEKLGVYLSSPKVVDNAVTSELFLVILLGTDQEMTLQNLPNAKLDYARSAVQVQQIVNSNNQLIEIPTPTPTLSPSPSPTSSGFNLAETSIGVIEQEQIPNTSQPSDPIVIPPVIITPTLIPSATLLPPPTSTQIQFPSSTATNIPTLTPAFTPTSPPTLTLMPTSVVLLDVTYIDNGEEHGCNALITFQVNGGAVTGSFRVWNAHYDTQNPPYSEYEMKTWPAGNHSDLVGLGGHPAENYLHKVWFVYNGISSDPLTNLICTRYLTP